MHYWILPQDGWDAYDQHKSLYNFLYETFIPLVNKGKWHYMNFSIDTAVFEDPIGNTLYVEFEVSKQKSFIKVIDMILQLDYPSKRSELSIEKLMQDIQQKYTLKRVEIHE